LRFLRTLVVCSLLAGVLALPAPAPAAATLAGQKAVASINKIRAGHGLRPLRVSPSLQRSSRRYAAWMLRHDYFGHLSRISVSSRFRRAGEALAMHSGWRPRWRWAVRAWMHSAPHRRILLSSNFSWIGIGVSRGRMGRSRSTTWVAHLGRR
jgi:uncharacterized protein YkwD